MNHEHQDEIGRMGWAAKPKDLHLVWVCRICGRIEEMTAQELIGLNSWGIAS